MAREKETRKELLEEPDLVTIYLHRIAGFFLTYRKQIISGIVAFMIIVVSVSGYFYYQNRMENAASVLFARAMTNYGAVLAAGGSPAEYDRVKEDFIKIFDNYGRTRIADLALVQHAGLCYRSGDFQKAVEQYEKALAKLPRNHRFRELALSGLAYAYEGLQDHESAIKHFGLVVQTPDAVTRDHALFKLGELYQKTGDPEKSKEAYEKLVSVYTDSIYYELANSTLQGL